MKIAAIFREYLPALRAKYGARLLPSHHQAIEAVLSCRTPEAGVMIVECPHCGKMEIKPSSCGHRSCPCCQNHEAGVWLDHQLEKLLPVPYFLVTFTVARFLRSLAWHHQRLVFGAMFDSAVWALRQLGFEDRFLGGELGFTGVLHTHNRRLGFHPHLHFLVSAGALDPRTRFWKRKDWHFLFPEAKLAEVFRNRLLGMLKNAGLPIPEIPGKWVVNCKKVGSGAPALKYLSQYLYRGVLPEKRIVSNQDGKVSFVYRESGSKQWKKRTLPGEDFLWLLLQHVLPRGFRRTRDFGFLHGNAKKTLKLIQLLLRAKIPPREEKPRPAFRCSSCGNEMKIIGRQPRVRSGRSPP